MDNTKEHLKNIVNWLNENYNQDSEPYHYGLAELLYALNQYCILLARMTEIGSQTIIGKIAFQLDGLKVFPMQ